MNSSPEDDIPPIEGREVLDADEQHQMALDFKNSGNVKFNSKDYQGAIVEYKKGLMHEINNADLHANISAAYIHLGKYVDAEEHANYTIHLRPTFYKGYLRSAKAAFMKGNICKSLKHLDDGMKAVTDAEGLHEIEMLHLQYKAVSSARETQRVGLGAEEAATALIAQKAAEDDCIEYVTDEDEKLYAECFARFREAWNSEGQHNGGLDPDVLQRLLSTDHRQEQIEVHSTIKINGKQIVGVQSSTEPLAELFSSASQKGFKKELRKPPKDDKKKVTASKEVSTSQTSLLNGLERKGRKKSMDDEDPDDSDMTPEVRNHLLKEQNRKDLKDNLKIGSKAFLSGNYRRAVDCYKTSKELVGISLSEYDIDDRQFHVIKYAYCASLINLENYDDIVRAIEELNGMQAYENSIPALYVQLARAYCKLNRFKTAVEPLEKVQDLIENCPIFPTFTWPGTDETIQETTPSGLKNAIKELLQISKMAHKPTAICRFQGCLKNSTHIVPSEFIYTSDPDFIGFIRLTCEEKCHIDFHISCWKSYKETLLSVGKVVDKYMLGQRCLTTDCINSANQPSVISVIDIIGADSEIKSQTKLDPKATSKNLKKRKGKEDDKALKPKKIKEKAVRESKKQPATAAEEEDNNVDPNLASVDSKKLLEKYKEDTIRLREENFGIHPNQWWDPKLKCCGNVDVASQVENNLFVDPSLEMPVEVKDAKEFLFSYFRTIFLDVGPLKMSDVEDLWKEAAGGFCDIKVVLPNLQSMCQLLLESLRFCQMEDYMCLVEQIDQTYEMVKQEEVEAVVFMMSGNAEAALAAAASEEPEDAVEVKNAQAAVTQVESHLSGEEESESEYSEEESEDADGEASDEDEKVETVENVAETSDVLADTAVASTSAALPEEDLPSCSNILDLGSKHEAVNLIDDIMSRLTGTEVNTLSKLMESAKVEPSQTEPDTNKEDVDVHNETFETAQGSSLDSYKSAEVVKEEEEEVFCSDDHSSNPDNSIEMQEEVVDVVTEEVVDVESVEDETTAVHCQNPEVEVTDVVNALQEAVRTKDKEIQSQPERKDKFSQTKNEERNKHLHDKIQDLTTKFAASEKGKTKLIQEMNIKDSQCKNLQSAHAQIVALLSQERKRFTEIQLKAEREVASLRKKLDEEFTNREQSQKRYTILANEKKQVDTQIQLCKNELATVKKENSSLNASNKELQNKNKFMTNAMKTLQQQHNQNKLNAAKTLWDTKLLTLKKRCVEKISEMQTLFSTLRSDQVESLPSWSLIFENIKAWNEISKNLKAKEEEFQAKYNEAGIKIAQGEEVEFDDSDLPSLPDEPSPLPLDKVIKEITEKNSSKMEELEIKVNELTQLVGSKQLEIEKNKEVTAQVMQMMSSFQMVSPRQQTPMTTAFGSLALQYPYPQTMPLQMPFGQQPVPTIPPPGPDATKLTTPSKPFHADMQTLLQESSKAIGLTSSSLSQQPVAEECSVSGDQTASPLLSSFPFLSKPPPTITPSTSLTPPPVGVAQNVLKSSSVAAEKKDTKVPERSRTPLALSLSSSRESTPAPSAAPTPPPEKVKKQKKSKVESKEAAELRMSFVGALKPATSADQSLSTTEDEGEWSVVGKSKFTFYQQQPLVVETKLKNKKKLLDKLQLRWPSKSLKELDDAVKAVREQNQNSLSGLPFHEIEARCELVLNRKAVQKSGELGLVKFSDAAWGTVKQPEIIVRANLQLEECIVCLEAMGMDRTKLDCNHEFHTQCLRKWLKEKRVCPLCNKFAAMPDEFPALM